MGSLLSSIIAIILFSVLLVAGLAYIDSDAIEAEGKAPLYASQVGDLVEAAQKFRVIRGVWPADLDDLRSEIDLSGPVLRDVDLQISDGFACVIMPVSQLNEQSLMSARDRFLKEGDTANLPANVSNKCGNVDKNNKIVLSVALNGTDIAPAGGYTLPDLDDSCGAEPAAEAPVAQRGKYLACYLSHSEAGYVRWVRSGRGLTPSLSEMISLGYVRQPPSWPDAPTFYGYAKGWPYRGLPINSPLSYGFVAVYGSSTIYGPLTRAVSENSSGHWKNSTYYNWHNYSDVIAWQEGDSVPDLVWDGPVPDNNASTSVKARYVAYWASSAYKAGKAWYAAGNTAKPSSAQLVPFGAVPRPIYTETTGIGVSDSWARCHGYNRVCIIVEAEQSFTQAVNRASYGAMRDDLYYVSHAYSQPINPNPGAEFD